MKKLVYYLAFLISIQVQAQSNIKIGEKAPAISVTDWIHNVPVDKDFTNKNIVLEFWATWCGPCIAAVPHMNDLQKKYKSKDLYYISITDESIEKVNRILKRVNFNSIVVSDQSKKTQIAFGDGKKGLEAYPLTILIDKKGIVKWIGEPKGLTEEVLQAFLNENLKATKQIAKSETRKDEIPDLGTNQPKDDLSDSQKFMNILTDKEHLYHFELKKTDFKSNGKNKLNNKVILYPSISLKNLYSDLFGVDVKNINVPSSLSGQYYYMLYKNLSTNEESLITLERVLLNTLNLTKRKEAKNVNAYYGQVNKAVLLDKALDEEFSSKSEAGDNVVFTSYTLSDLFKEINEYSPDNFILDDKIDGKFDFLIGVKTSEDIVNSLKSYGIKVKKGLYAAEVVSLEIRSQ